ncbi:hypothetical protein SAMN04487943_101301 [Gracilibacillus orientalis]|uniref:Uncharacterized protein n=1 Tax=Gracilibacillus orientalis TaxID=334253 RepID=A0A1I4H9K8_9BACI|nr:hypothetical protein [Gracilibacillus orientalis]SFL38855.1 hypothetical protein SAMN04487943_101301 [Gracilibacillus orientalis]
MNKLIIDTLESTGIPVAYEKYRGSESEYIRFFYLPQVDFQADDDETYETVYIQVDIFTPGNPKNYAKQVKQLLKEVGFKKNFEHETYEEDTKLFHYVLRFYTIEEEY